jgi:hypothetical protein
MLFREVAPLKTVNAVNEKYGASRVNVLKAASRMNISWQADLEYCVGKGHPEWAWINQPSVRAALDNGPVSASKGGRPRKYRTEAERRKANSRYQRQFRQRTVTT